MELHGWVQLEACELPMHNQAKERARGGMCGEGVGGSEGEAWEVAVAYKRHGVLGILGLGS